MSNSSGVVSRKGVTATNPALLTRRSRGGSAATALRVASQSSTSTEMVSIDGTYMYNITQTLRYFLLTALKYNTYKYQRLIKEVLMGSP